jgi:hypothetical protein
VPFITINEPLPFDPLEFFSIFGNWGHSQRSNEKDPRFSKGKG